MNNKILITGGTGLVGTILVNQLINLGFKVRILTRNSIKNTDKVEYFKGDISKVRNIQKALLGCYAVFHCAGEKNDNSLMYETNVIGTKNIFFESKKAGIKFFCHLSSVGVIGKTNLKIVDEKSPCIPMNNYESTKLQAEAIVQEGLINGRVVILRPTNIFNENIFNEYINNSIKRRIKIWIRYKENSNLVYVENVTAAAIFFLNNITDISCETFIVSNDEEIYSIGRIESFIKALKGKPLKKHLIIPPLFIPWFIRKLRNGNSNKGNIVYSSKKLNSTGFKMPYSVLDGIKKNIDINKI
jgi:nucleoside-diphosphate-sugar epimerase